MPVSEDDIREAYRQGRFVPKPIDCGLSTPEPIWCDGCGQWVPYSQCPWCAERRREEQKGA